MKKTFFLILILLAAVSAFAQDHQQDTVEKKNWFQRLFSRPTVVVHDTIYIYENDTEDFEDSFDEDQEENESSGSIPMPFDTLSTDNRYLKVILFDNGSWLYYEIPKPDLPDFISNDHWMTRCMPITTSRYRTCLRRWILSSAIRFTDGISRDMDGWCPPIK